MALPNQNIWVYTLPSLQPLHISLPWKFLSKYRFIWFSSASYHNMLLCHQHYTNKDFGHGCINYRGQMPRIKHYNEWKEVISLILPREGFRSKYFILLISERISPIMCTSKCQYYFWFHLSPTSHSSNYEQDPVLITYSCCIAWIQEWMQYLCLGCQITLHVLCSLWLLE